VPLFGSRDDDDEAIERLAGPIGQLLIDKLSLFSFV
jgi:hypothetical protein